MCSLGAFGHRACEALARKAGYLDEDVIELFRQGAPIVGKLDRYSLRDLVALLGCSMSLAQCRAGIGKHLEYNATVSPEELESNREIKNKKLLKTLKEDTRLSPHLLAACKADADMGRMLEPRLVGSNFMNLSDKTLSPRFGVEQGRYLKLVCACLSQCDVCVLLGTKSNGTKKVRPIDDMTRQCI